jgi:hypothetical protein
MVSIRTDRLDRREYEGNSELNGFDLAEAKGTKMREDDLDYSRRRAKEEAARALSLADTRIADVHRRLAAAHRDRVAQLSSAPAHRAVPLSLSA